MSLHTVHRIVNLKMSELEEESREESSAPQNITKEYRGSSWSQKTQKSVKGIKLDKVAAYRVIVAALRLGTKPQHVSPQEKQFMFNLKKSGMSNLQLSIIFQRSKETIYRTLKEMEV